MSSLLSNQTDLEQLSKWSLNWDKRHTINEKNIMLDNLGKRNEDPETKKLDNKMKIMGIALLVLFVIILASVFLMNDGENEDDESKCDNCTCDEDCECC